MQHRRSYPPQQAVRVVHNWSVSRLVAFSATALVAAACQPKTDTAKAESAVVTPAAAPVVVGQPPVWSLSEFGYGPIVVGMSYKAANDSLKGALKAAKDANLTECDYVKWEGGPAGLGIMVIEGSIARVDVRDSSDIPTDAGARVGDTEAHVKSLYGTRLTVSNHKYEDGHYLTVRSANGADTLHLIVFETAQGKITRIRAGAKPGVEYIEGCS